MRPPAGARYGTHFALSPPLNDGCRRGLVGRAGIPFFGAAVSGQKHAAPAWQRAIVLLLGPLPGLALGVALLVAFRPPGELTVLAAILLVLINGFNLLPFVPLDGGRLLSLLIFARHPVSESAFLLFSAVGLAVVGWLLGSWVLGLLA